MRPPQLLLKTLDLGRMTDTAQLEQREMEAKCHLVVVNRLMDTTLSRFEEAVHVVKILSDEIYKRDSALRDARDEYNRLKLWVIERVLDYDIVVEQYNNLWLQNIDYQKKIDALEQGRVEKAAVTKIPEGFQTFF